MKRALDATEHVRNVHQRVEETEAAVDAVDADDVLWAIVLPHVQHLLAPDLVGHPEVAEVVPVDTAARPPPPYDVVCRQFARLRRMALVCHGWFAAIDWRRMVTYRLAPYVAWIHTSSPRTPATERLRATWESVTSDGPDSQGNFGRSATRYLMMIQFVVGRIPIRLLFRRICSAFPTGRKGPFKLLGPFFEEENRQIITPATIRYFPFDESDWNRINAAGYHYVIDTAETRPGGTVVYGPSTGDITHVWDADAPCPPGVDPDDTHQYKWIPVAATTREFQERAFAHWKALALYAVSHADIEHWRDSRR